MKYELPILSCQNLPFFNMLKYTRIYTDKSYGLCYFVETDQWILRLFTFYAYEIEAYGEKTISYHLFCGYLMTEKQIYIVLEGSMRYNSKQKHGIITY